MIYVNKLEKRVSFKTKTGYYLQLLMPETMKLPGITKLNITKLKITKDKNDKNVPHLEVILIHLILLTMIYQQGSRVLYTFVYNKPFRQLFDVSPKNVIFLKSF